MRLLTFSLAAALAAAPAYAGSQNCTRAGDVRTIEVVTPGVIGSACDLKYIRENGNNISVPYHADYSASFCLERAAALVASLVASGYACAETTAAVPLREVQAAPETSSAELLGAAPVAEASAESAAAPFESAAGQVIPEPPVAQTAYPDAPIVAEIPAEASDSSVLEQPAAASDQVELADATSAAASEEVISADETMASRGPTALSPTLASTPATTKAPRSSVVGRLVGAAPDATPQPVLAASEERLSPAARMPATEAVEAEETRLASASPPSTGARPAADIIRGVLTAQAAAWNEGDLEAFMGGYWKSPEVRFVSGTTVTKGWQQTLKRYRERYGQGASLGRLSFDGLDVQMVTDDVAVIVGRFNLASGAAAEAGAFTLVMKRFDGLWRIVHDHSVGDPAPTE